MDTNIPVLGGLADARTRVRDYQGIGEARTSGLKIPRMFTPTPHARKPAFPASSARGDENTLADLVAGKRHGSATT